MSVLVIKYVDITSKKEEKMEFVDYFEKGKKIGQGVQGSVYEIKGDNTKVLKIINPTKKKKIINEINTAKIAGNIFPQVSPKVHFAMIVKTPNNDYEGYFVMDKIVGKTLNSVKEFEKYKTVLLNKIVKLRKNGIIVDDLGGNNIMIGTMFPCEKPDIYIIDYGGCEEVSSLKFDENMYKTKMEEVLETEIKPQLNGFIKQVVPLKTKSLISAKEQKKRAMLWMMKEHVKKTLKKTNTKKSKPSSLKKYSHHTQKKIKINTL